MKIRLFKDGEQHGPFPVEEVWRLIDERKFSSGDLAWHERKKKWVPVRELLYAKQHQSGGSSTVKAGWICLALGLCTFWVLGLGFFFFSVTIILSIVAMCTDQLKQGIALICSVVCATAVCWFLIMIFALSIPAFFLMNAVGTAHQGQPRMKFQGQTLPASQSPQTFPRASSQPVPITSSPIGLFRKSGAFLASQEALTGKEISLMLKGGVSQSEIIQSVHQRGVVNAMIGSEAAALQQLGATQSLLRELRDDRWVLAPDEYQRYLSRRSSQVPNRLARSPQMIGSSQASQADELERQRLQGLQDQQLANAAEERREQESRRAKTEQQQQRDRNRQDLINKGHLPASVADLLYKP